MSRQNQTGPASALDRTPSSEKTSIEKRRRRQSSARRLNRRALNVQALDARILLAADISSTSSFPPPVDDAAAIESSIDQTLTGDVNEDGRVSAVDALTIINRMRRGDGATTDHRRMDVNGDGRVTALDALNVINRMRRGGGRDAPESPDSPGDPSLRIDDSSDPSDANIEIQSFDGIGNNLDHPELGSTGIEFSRLVDADYADGISDPAGADRLSAREVSNIVFDQQDSIPNSLGLSNLVWQWGQFIDHDITLTAHDDGDSLDIAVPAGDEHFDPFGTGEQLISFTRSTIAEGTGVDNAAQQINEITAFIDGSMVYGSDTETADSLRAFEGGRLRTSDGDLLPINEQGFFEAGDVRANEQLGLISMHTLWVREHNRIADELSGTDQGLTDEEIYQSARRQVIAQLQAITFNEYLPQLVGRDAIDRYEGYDATVDPSISNLFATAAFRYGHTALPTELARLNDDGIVIDAGSVALQDAFFNPSEIVTHGIDSVLKGLASTSQQEIDTQLVDDVRNFLFGPPGSGGFDLAALNIQRGRDHGLPDYNSARESIGLERVESFADITNIVDVQAKLAEAYESVDDIDAWVGMLAEDPTDGASVGELAGAVIAQQFMALRDGDRFWYQNVMSPEEAREIGSTGLSDVIERNTQLTTIQENAFRVNATTDRNDVPRPEQPRDPADRPDRLDEREPNDRSPNDRPDGNREPLDGEPRNREPRNQENGNQENGNREVGDQEVGDQERRPAAGDEKPSQPIRPPVEIDDRDEAPGPQERRGGLNSQAVDELIGRLF